MAHNRSSKSHPRARRRGAFVNHKELDEMITNKLYPIPLSTTLDNAVRKAEKEREFKKQHGPVKVIMKDGKLCP